jgi:hypothetical protein
MDYIWSRYKKHVRKEKNAVTRKGGISGPMLMGTFFIVVLCRASPQILAMSLNYTLYNPILASISIVEHKLYK